MTKQTLTRLAKKLDCRIEFAPMWDITAPDGKCFASDPQCHYIVFEPWDDVSVGEMYQDAYDRLSPGLMDCNCTECAAEAK